MRLPAHRSVRRGHQRVGAGTRTTQEGATTAEAVRWRVVIEGEPGRGSWNMALDHALADSAVPGQGVLRLYRWERPTISFGRNEPSRGTYAEEAARAEGFDFVRRPTGGRAVLHADEVTYSVVLPLGALGGMRQTYVRINEGLVAGVRALGCPAEVVGDGTVLALDAGPCFQVPAPGEVTLGGRKLVGSAQVRIGRAILQHGSLILSGDQDALSRFGGSDGGAPPATLAGHVGRVPWARVARALVEGLTLALGGAWGQGDITLREEARARELEDTRYATPEWTWRR